MIVVSPFFWANPVMVTRRQPIATISRAMASTSSCGANIHRPSRRSSTGAAPGTADSFAMSSARGISRSRSSMFATRMQKGVTNMPAGRLTPAVVAQHALLGFQVGKRRAVDLLKGGFRYRNDRAATARARVIEDFMRDAQLRLVAGDRRQLTVIGDGVGRAVLHAKAAERALTGKEVPGDPGFVRITERDRVGRANIRTSPATRAQAHILLDQPAEGWRSRRHILEAPRPRAMCEVPPDDVEDAHPTFP